MILLVIVCLAGALYGVWYAVDPVRFLRRKGGEGEISKTAINTARVFGIVLAVASIAYMIGTLLRSMN